IITQSREAPHFPYFNLSGIFFIRNHLGKETSFISGGENFFIGTASCPLPSLTTRENQAFWRID
ncbi:MAG: hypothetical protein O9275_02955, partial [Microcystis sp. LE19-196.1B]|nr:hypothetical protein [Microcystis sp. LE19-196.1B]